MKAARAQGFTLWQDIGLLVGRVLMGWIFVESSWRKLGGMDAFIASLVNRRVPYATILGWIGAPVEFFGGLALVLGAATRYGALLIIAFTIVATLIGHRYWEFTDAAARRMQQSHFAKNLTILGGLVLLFVTGAGRLSIDGAQELRRERVAAAPSPHSPIRPRCGKARAPGRAGATMLEFDET